MEVSSSTRISIWPRRQALASRGSAEGRAPRSRRRHEDQTGRRPRPYSPRSIARQPQTYSKRQRAHRSDFLERRLIASVRADLGDVGHAYFTTPSLESRRQSARSRGLEEGRGHGADRRQGGYRQSLDAVPGGLLAVRRGRPERSSSTVRWGARLRPIIRTSPCLRRRMASCSPRNRRRRLPASRRRGSSRRRAGALPASMSRSTPSSIRGRRGRLRFAALRHRGHHCIPRRGFDAALSRADGQSGRGLGATRDGALKAKIAIPRRRLNRFPPAAQTKGIAATSSSRPTSRGRRVLPSSISR